MKAIVNTGPNRLEMLDMPLPEPGPGQVRVRTAACAICATDLQMIAGWERTAFPCVPGHEWSGRVDAVGEGCDKSLIGSLCVGENVLSDGGEVGFEHPGGYAQFLLTEAANLRVLPDAFDPIAATLIEPLAVCVRAIGKLGGGIREPVLIFGDGAIGLISLMLLRRSGAREITLIGGRNDRLALAGRLGAGTVLNYHDLGSPMENEIARLASSHASPARKPGETGALGHWPSIIEVSGSAAAIRAAMNLVSQCGRILVVGDYAHARADFAWNNLLHREIQLIGSNASAGAWPEAARLAVGGLSLARLVTHRLPAAQFARGIELLISRSEGTIKVVLEWQ
ncbi:MAG TPA: zinc-binding dehydrogenase [Candidatus Brocadiia bacterium]|nr:zinc-binding dehydrogenase [Candidatus Brocadiia bacterium]